MPKAQPIARAMSLFAVIATAVFALGSSSCFDSDSIECDNGFVCPAGSRCAANQQACIFDECGDGEIDPGEECDNGDIIIGDGCNAACQLENCGNGKVDSEAGEICDDGGECSDGTACARNSDCAGIGDGTCSGTDDGTCAADCHSLNECGNMVTNAGEECDDGNNTDGDGCDTNCTVTGCGNGVRTGTEACDDGGTCSDGTTNCESDLDCTGIGDETCTPQSGDGCDADCTVSGCGNNVVSASEVCDNGRQCSNGANCSANVDCIGIGDQQCIPRDRDGCSADCASDETCGNNVTDTTVGEVCDNGKQCQNGTTCTADAECAGIGDAQCKTRSGDGCNNTCASNETCGNGFTDTAVNEVCDDGEHCTNGNPCTQNSDCAGIGDEQCAPRSGDGCSADCDSDESCGNGQVDVGENCDDGKHCDDSPGAGSAGTPCDANSDCTGIGDGLCLTRDGDGCSADCSSSEGCGNGSVDVGEQCDDQNGIDTDDCVACMINVCGDGFVDLQGPDTEDCDSGVGNVATCDADCTVAECGDGFVNPKATAVAGPGGEQCDNLKTCANGSSCTVNANCTGDGDGLCRARNSATCDEDCTVAFCGDGLTNTVRGETCDDSGESITCNYNCTAAACHDGILNLSAGELCDDNNTNDDDACVANCTFAFCGDGFTRTGVEQCDPGASGESASCNRDCTNAVCHDGKLNFSAGEECDDNNTIDTDACVDNCVAARCGDNHVRAGVEQCDDGGLSTTCNVDCTTSACHDGKLNTLAGEECDDNNTVDTDACVDSCKIAVCGDNHVWSGVEQCDTGGESAACNVDCTTSACHDGKVNLSAGEQCDDGNTTDTDACVDDCKVAVCGDSHVRAGVEQCDDGGESVDCNYNCTNSVCHDGILNVTDGEQCDDGNTSNTDACVGSCVLARCGDGNTWAGVEACDSAGESISCNIDCTVAACHDGKVNFTAGEQCDDGNMTDTDACVDNCKIATCGDSHVRAGVEECDDGNPDNNDDCLSSCVANVCGDGFVDGQGPVTEACDDGNLVTESECPYGTQSCFACSADCGTPLSLTGRYCGDGVEDTGDGEQCDDGNAVNETSCPYGVASCDGCSTTCQDILGLTGNVCGDGDRDLANEACDDGNTDSCGTCSDTCNVAQGLTAATGTISATAPDADGMAPWTGVADGDTLTLFDGFNAVIIFEFDDDTSLAIGSVAIDISSANNANDVRDAIIAAINGAANLDITAAQTTGSGNLTLTNDTASALGNQLIADTVGDPDFATTGMSGGSGADCALDVGCASADDCASGFCRGDGTCGCNDDGDCTGGDVCNLTTNACEAP